MTSEPETTLRLDEGHRSQHRYVATGRLGAALTDWVSADTDDLDAFVEHGDSLQTPLRSVYETLARQRNYLLSAGLPHTVENSEVRTLDSTLVAMADLDRFVGDISSSLKRVGTDVGHGVFEAPSIRIGAELARVEPVERAGADDVDDVDASAVAAGLIEANQTTASTLHARPRLSVERLAADLYFGNHAVGFTSAELLDEALRSRLSETQYRQVHEQLELLYQRERIANVSLLNTSPSGTENREVGVEIGGDLNGLTTQTQQLYQDNQVGAPYGGAPRLDEPEIAYQLQRIAEGDPGRALGVKWLLDRMLTPYERAELDRVLATNGTFSERVGLAIAHPVDGITGAAKGAWNDNFGWLVDGLADAQVAVTNGLYGMAIGSTPASSPELQRFMPQVPRTWEENDSIVELEFAIDNLAEQGGADIAFAVELASAAYGGGKGGLSVIRIGRRYFLRNGDDIVATLSPRLASQLDEGIELAGSSSTPDGAELIRPLGRGSTVNGVDRFHPRTLRERLAIEEVMQNPSAGRSASGQMGDPRWPGTDGWKKLQQTISPRGGEGPVTVHYNYNAVTGEVDDFKILQRKPHVPEREPEVPSGEPISGERVMEDHEGSS